jgi:hypothetical protein
VGKRRSGPHDEDLSLGLSTIVFAVQRQIVVLFQTAAAHVGWASRWAGRLGYMEYIRGVRAGRAQAIRCAVRCADPVRGALSLSLTPVQRRRPFRLRNVSAKAAMEHMSAAWVWSRCSGMVRGAQCTPVRGMTCGMLSLVGCSRFHAAGTESLSRSRGELCSTGRWRFTPLWRRLVVPCLG